MSALYINRELSWLKFNERVLEEACDTSVPLYERLRFLSIFSSNLDEFYMVRVGSLLDQSLLGGNTADTKTGMLPKEQIAAINAAVQQLYPRRDAAYTEILRNIGVFSHVSYKSLDGGEKRMTRAYFESEVLPLLSPQIIDARHPFPHLENKVIYIGVRLKCKTGKLFGIVPITREIDRVYFIPESNKFMLVEDILLRFVDEVFGVYEVEAKGVFRVTRNADIDVQEGMFDEDIDYRNYMQEIIKKRGKLSPVRLETDHAGDAELLGFFLSKLRLNRNQCFVTTSPLDFSFVGVLEKQIGAEQRAELVFSPLRPRWPAGVVRSDLISQVLQRDILLSYPFESMRPLVELIREAAEDSKVVSIKMTLYRIGHQSQIVQNLCAAAENGKDVTVLIELRARFDEQNNINWSRLLEDAGCKVIYGIEDFKVHAKVVLITRKQGHGLEYITNIATGNYNESTARFYVDLSLMTANPEIGEDAMAFFHNVSINNLNGVYQHLLVAPSSLKQGVLSLMDAEIAKAQNGAPGRIIAKMNSITDKEIIDKMIEASEAGVNVDLIVRGICCLCPGVPGKTDHIRVRSIVGRFLEHSRIYIFGEDSEAKVYLSSADWMTRNTERRVEVAIPVLDSRLAGRIMGIVDILLRDNVKARELQPDGSYVRVSREGEDLNSQMYFYRQAYRAAEQVEEKPKRNWFDALVSRIRFNKRK
ncbi:polyphosphate kinase 1 [Ethanoligenens sp.]|uniref:polyphosphate kinase 1 n=1 Tax=Ethanoligenens sp. TaxID=2099655 RepID=UPI0039ED3CC2